MRHLLSVFTLLFIITTGADLSATEPQRGIVWQVEKKGLKPAYIMGTVHSDDGRVLRLPDKVKEIFQRTSSFTAELKLDLLAMQQASSMMFYADGKELKSIIGAQRYQTCVSLMTGHGVPEMLLRNMKPWAVAVTLSMPKSKTGMVLDMVLYQQAAAQGKQLYGLETPGEQVAVFETFTIQQQITMLDDAIKHYRELPAMVEELVGYYLQRDLTGLERISEKYMARGDRMLAQSFKKKALLDRNYRMVRRMQPRLLEGNSFIAVGALHLPGEEGILRLLEKQGYKVTPVY